MLRGLRIAALCVMAGLLLVPVRLGAIGRSLSTKASVYAAGGLGRRRRLRRLCPDASPDISGASSPATRHSWCRTWPDAAGAVAAGNLYNVPPKTGPPWRCSSARF